MAYNFYFSVFFGYFFPFPLFLTLTLQHDLSPFVAHTLISPAFMPRLSLPLSFSMLYHRNPLCPRLSALEYSAAHNVGV